VDFFENCFQNLKKLGHKIGAEKTEFDRFGAKTRQKLVCKLASQKPDAEI